MARTISAYPRSYARSILRQQGESTDFIKAVTAYVDAETFIREGIGRPDYNMSRAQKDAGKLGLSESEDIRAITTAIRLYQEFLSLTPKEQKNPGLRRIRRKTLENRLRRRYERLRSYSDTDITILNSNLRVDFYTDPVYRGLGKDVRQKMRDRTLTEAEYRTLEEIISRPVTEESPDEMSLDVLDAIPDELMSLSMFLLSQDKPLQGRVLNWDMFQEYVIRLLSGETLSISEMQSNKIYSNTVLEKARSILRNYYVQQAEREWISSPHPRETRVSVRTGIDPQHYEEGLIVRRRV